MISRKRTPLFVLVAPTIALPIAVIVGQFARVLSPMVEPAAWVAYLALLLFVAIGWPLLCRVFARSVGSQVNGIALASLISIDLGLGVIGAFALAVLTVSQISA